MYTPQQYIILRVCRCIGNRYNNNVFNTSILYYIILVMIINGNKNHYSNLKNRTRLLHVVAACVLYTWVYYIDTAYTVYTCTYRTYTIVLPYTYIILYARRVNIVDGGGKIQQPLYSCTRISYSIFISETTATAPRACTYIYIYVEGLYVCVYVYI